ncbi:MAG: excisionase family DNA-binding protein [Chloroflexota bacterium]
MTVSEVAQRIRVSPELVRRWLREGRLRGVRLGGTRLGWRIPDDEVERFLLAAGLNVLPSLPADPAIGTRADLPTPRPMVSSG